MSATLVLTGGLAVAIGIICILSAGYSHELDRRRHYEAAYRALAASQRNELLARLTAAREAAAAQVDRAVADFRADLDRWGQSS